MKKVSKNIYYNYFHKLHIILIKIRTFASGEILIIIKTF